MPNELGGLGFEKGVREATLSIAGEDIADSIFLKQYLGGLVVKAYVLKDLTRRYSNPAESASFPWAASWGLTPAQAIRGLRRRLIRKHRRYHRKKHYIEVPFDDRKDQ